MEPVVTLSLGRPTSGGVPGAMPAASSPPDIERQLREGLAELAAKGRGGDVGARAALELLVPGSKPLLSNISVDVAGRMSDSAPEKSSALAPTAYEYAGELVDAGRLREASVVLCAVAGLPGAAFDGLLGLALCALRLGRPEVALALAQECLKRDPRHPRACCIAAHCELKRGDRRSAQSYYALAARVARTRPEFRDDLRAAQRALLLMHLA